MINNEVLVSISKIAVVMLCLSVIVIVIWQNTRKSIYPRLLIPLLLGLFALSTWSILNPNLPASFILLYSLAVLLYLIIKYPKLGMQGQKITYNDNSHLIAQTQEQERSRIYANLHDDVGAKLLELIYSAKNETTKKLAKEVLTDIRQAVAKTENIQCDVAQLAELIITESALRVETTTMIYSSELNLANDDKKLEIVIPNVILRIIREAISNIIKHAQAKRVHVNIESTDALLTIKVEDDGIGLPEKKLTGKGLKTMRKRAKTIASEVKWLSKQNKGTTFILKYTYGN